jgi:DNA-binding response OmpR family regulator
MQSVAVMKILVVEDDRKVGQFIVNGLAELAYTSRLAASCSAARHALSQETYDAIVLDLGLPDGEGLDLLAEWRRHGFNEPVLILSARDAVGDRVRGLNLGADDYLAKPFNFEELLARLRALFRRQADRKQTILSQRGIVLDLLSHTVEFDGAPVALTHREFSLLELLLQNPGRILTRTVIAEKIWDAHYDMETNLIDVYVRRLRQKFESSPERPLIKTIRGMGYQFLV